MKRGSFRVAIVVFSFCIACSDRLLEQDAPLDTTFPVVQVFEPARGTILSGQSLWVRGRVTDDKSVKTLSVGNEQIEIDVEGYFETLLSFPKNGLHIIETSVVDGSGNETNDVRSVMSMSENASTDVIKDAVSLFLGPQAFVRIGDMMEAVFESDSIPEAIVALEPIETGGSCLGATMDIEKFEYEGTDVTLSPESGVVRVDTTIRNVRSDIDTRFKFSCIPGRTDVIATVDEVKIGGELSIQVIDEKVVASTDETLMAELVGFDIDVNNFPGALESLIRGSIRSRIEDFVEEYLKETVPELFAGVFEGFSGGQAVTFFEKEMFVKVIPTAIEIETRGLDLNADASTFIDGFTAPHNNVIVETPATGESGNEFEMYMSTEFVNQFSATLWSSGALDMAVPIEGTGQLAAVASELTLGWLLPPFIDKTIDLQKFELKIGDAFTLASSPDGVVTQIAISSLVEVDLGIADGLFALEGQANSIWLDILEEGVTGANVFANSETEALASHAARHGIGILLDALNGRELPIFQGLKIKSADVDASIKDFVALKGSLEVAEVVEVETENTL